MSTSNYIPYLEMDIHFDEATDMPRISIFLHYDDGQKSEICKGTLFLLLRSMYLVNLQVQQNPTTYCLPGNYEVREEQEGAFLINKTTNIYSLFRNAPPQGFLRAFAKFQQVLIGLVCSEVHPYQTNQPIKHPRELYELVDGVFQQQENNAPWTYELSRVYKINLY